MASVSVIVHVLVVGHLELFVLRNVLVLLLSCVYPCVSMSKGAVHAVCTSTNLPVYGSSLATLIPLPANLFGLAPMPTFTLHLLSVETSQPHCADLG